LKRLEPWIDPVVPVETAKGASQRWVDRALLDWLEPRTSALGAVLDAPAAGRPSTRLPGPGEAERMLLCRADAVVAEQQPALQARAQAHVDGGVSTTVHLPEDATADRIAGLFPLARALGCKGAAFWRRTGDTPATCIRCAG